MDTFEGTYDKSLARGARASVREVLAVKKGERVLIIANPGEDVREISMAIYDAALGVGGAPTLVFQREKGQFDLAEEEVIKALAAEPEIALSISSDRLGKDKWGLKNGYKGKRRYDHIYDMLYEEKKIRGFWSPGITKDMFARTVPIDYSRLRKDSAGVCKLLSGADKVTVTAPGGTDLTIGLKGRKPRPDDGDFRLAGKAGNIPSGEVYVSPALGTMEGTIAFDGSIVLDEGEIVIRKPILTEITKGYISGIEGGNEASKLEKAIAIGERKAREAGRKGAIDRSKAPAYVRNARSIGELGIGLNRKATIVANMLEDEKVYGTCHFAVGSNYDGDAEALIHLDGLVKRPTIIASTRGSQKPIMVDGRLIWD